ncbi:MAG: hypothetical protein K2W95_04715 [Candidatus Obscuribacterales bacterium]|nr:hypothetical protein [Candidatus Obscuribacterales bacterium]
MNCSCPEEKVRVDLCDLVETAKKVLRTAGDPFTAVIKFLHDRPEDVSMAGLSVKQILLDAFGAPENVPGLVRLLSAHVREVVRHHNVIDVRNEHLAQEFWSGYLIKLKEQVKFEVARERDKLLLKNIAGLVAVEHGIELPLERILVNPPKLEITVRLGLLRPVRCVDIMAS